MEMTIAALIFFGIPLMFVAWTAFLIFTGRTKSEAEIYPLGDATETPRTIVNIRRANQKSAS